jgi:hypothetical protein
MLYIIPIIYKKLTKLSVGKKTKTL